MNVIVALIGVATLLLPEVASAQGDPCLLVPGGCPPENLFLTSIVPTAASVLLRLAGGLSIIFLIWACLQIVLSWGDESKITTARNGIMYALVGIGVTVTSQLAISFVVTEGSAFSMIGPIDFDIAIMANIVRVMLSVFNVLMAVMIFLAGVRMLMARGKIEEYNKARTIVVWSIAAALIANSAHFGVQTVIGTFMS